MADGLRVELVRIGERRVAFLVDRACDEIERKIHSFFNSSDQSLREVNRGIALDLVTSTLAKIPPCCRLGAFRRG
jgi:hypothetical protein